jgi:hypothetical protein
MAEGMSKEAKEKIAKASKKLGINQDTTDNIVDTADAMYSTAKNIKAQKDAAQEKISQLKALKNRNKDELAWEIANLICEKKARQAKDLYEEAKKLKEFIAKKALQLSGMSLLSILPPIPSSLETPNEVLAAKRLLDSLKEQESVQEDIKAEQDFKTKIEDSMKRNPYQQPIDGVPAHEALGALSDYQNAVIDGMNEIGNKMINELDPDGIFMHPDSDMVAIDNLIANGNDNLKSMIVTGLPILPNKNDIYAQSLIDMNNRLSQLSLDELQKIQSPADEYSQIDTGMFETKKLYDKYNNVISEVQTPKYLYIDKSNNGITQNEFDNAWLEYTLAQNQIIRLKAEQDAAHAANGQTSNQGNLFVLEDVTPTNENPSNIKEIKVDQSVIDRLYFPNNENG